MRGTSWRSHLEKILAVDSGTFGLSPLAQQRELKKITLASRPQSAPESADGMQAPPDGASAVGGAAWPPAFGLSAVDTVIRPLERLIDKLSKGLFCSPGC